MKARPQYVNAPRYEDKYAQAESASHCKHNMLVARQKLEHICPPIAEGQQSKKHDIRHTEH